MTADNAVSVEQLTYEQAFTELETIVATLEVEERSLDAALTLFARGQDLARYCSALLDQAEVRVQQITGETLVEFKSPA